MKKLILSIGLVVGAAALSQAATKTAVTIGDGTVQAGSTTPFHTYAGTVDTFTATNATVSSMTITTATIQNIGTTFIGLGRNRVINGDFRWDQRNEGAAVTLGSNTNTYGCDTFFGYNRGYPGKFTMQRVTTSPPPDFSYNWKISITSATLFVASSETANAEYVTSTRIEGPNWSDSSYATAYAKTCTLSFWVRSSSAGYYGASLESSSSDPDTYPFHYQIASANVWYKISITIPGDTGGSNWAFLPGTIGLKIIWDLGSGTAFAKTSSAWYGGSSQEYNHFTNDNRIIKILNATWELAGVQLEFGSQATAFEFVPYQVSQKWVNRFYEKSYAAGVVPGTNTGNGSGSNAMEFSGAQLAAAESNFYLKFKESKISTTPTVTFYSIDGTINSMKCFNTAGTGTNRTVSQEVLGSDGVGFYETSAVENYAQGHYTCENNL